ncbi:MAG TPA: hypothetical protein VK511_13185 [Gemmatimonadaceae bacterium]|nr:hypothetical protein [Gemmatimonadaceae bacterium]
MIATTARALLTRRFRRFSALRAFATLAVVLVACTGHESSSSGESAASVAGPNAQAGVGRGHLQLNGDATVDTDFAVEQCTIGPAGDGLLDGYHMNAKATRGTLQLLSLAVKSYDGDGTFSPPVDTGKTTSVGKRGVSGPLSITIGRENTTAPLPVITRPESRLTITISDSGSRGTAEFTDMTSPVAMEDVEIKAPLHAKPKSFAGSLSWHCSSVEHLDAATTDAAKSMTKGLTPIH